MHCPIPSVASVATNGIGQCIATLPVVDRGDVFIGDAAFFFIVKERVELGLGLAYPGPRVRVRVTLEA